MVEKLRQQMDGKPVEDFWADVCNWYYNQELWEDRMNMVSDGLCHHNQTGYIGTDNAQRIYPQPLYSTVSRIEQFVNCPFAHFVRYGLKPQERKIFTVGAPDIGELFHNSLLSFALRLKQQNKNWFELKRSECDLIMDGIMDELVPQHGYGVFASSHRYRYLIQRLKRISRRAVWILTEHIQRGKFEPLQYEVSFGPACPFPAIEIELGNGEKFYLVGRIDRVDLLEGEEETYIKIIDYKSGNQDFKLSDVYHGLSLQLMIYLQAVLASGERLQRGRLKPGGIFYFKIDDPLINTESGIIENIEKEIAKKLKMKGLVLEDTHLVRQLDNRIAGNSEIIPVALNVDGGFSKNSSVLLEEDLAALIQHVEGLLRRIGGEIMNGRVKIEPIKNGQHTACGYCSYKSICQFDRQLEDNNYKNIRPLKNEEVVTRIQGNKEAASIADMD
jgi:ATP-dependent helicase/nuclease subunit B